MNRLGAVWKALTLTAKKPPQSGADSRFLGASRSSMAVYGQENSQ
jgi:hypothetical protein